MIGQDTRRQGDGKVDFINIFKLLLIVQFLLTGFLFLLRLPFGLPLGLFIFGSPVSTWNKKKIFSLENIKLKASVSTFSNRFWTPVILVHKKPSWWLNNQALNVNLYTNLLDIKQRPKKYNLSSQHFVFSSFFKI